jgi:hypothetical protein
MAKLPIVSGTEAVKGMQRLGWHHHMALILSAHLFLLREKIHNAEGFPLLSCQDIVIMLEFYPPERDETEDEIFRQLKARHRK